MNAQSPTGWFWSIETRVATRPGPTSSGVSNASGGIHAALSGVTVVLAAGSGAAAKVSADCPGGAWNGRVVGVCRCTDDFCQSFHTAPEAPGGHGEGHRNVWVRAPWPGYLVLDVVADDIVYVEVLYRSPLD